MKKGVFILITILLIFLSGCDNKPVNIEPIEDFQKPIGAGSSEDPYQIKTVKELKYINQELSAHYVLMNNIDLSEYDWVPIGQKEGEDEAELFEGVFNGNGFIINNLTINENINNFECLGLFAKNTGTITNLGLENVNITGGAETTGTIAGENRSRGTIKESYSTGYIKRDKGGAFTYIGGLVGCNEGIIENTYTHVNINYQYVVRNSGGLVGTNYGSVKSSYSTGTIKVGNKREQTGGLVGTVYYDGTLINSFTTSNVDGRNSGSLTSANSDNSANIVNNYEYLGQIVSSMGSKYLSDNLVSLEELNTKQWYIDTLNWDEQIWDLNVISEGYYPIHKNSHAELVALPTSYPLGSRGNPIKIYTKEDFINLKDTVYIDVYYELMNNIDLTDVNWTPLGTEEEPFRGYFEGNGYTISNISIEGDYKYAGLFGYYYGDINNLHLNNVDIEITHEGVSYAGGLVGFLNQYGDINDCTATNVNITFTKIHSGNLAGNEDFRDI